MLATAATNVIPARPTTNEATVSVTGKNLPIEQKNLQSSTEQLRATVPILPPDIQRILDRGNLLISMPKKDNPPFFAVDEKGQYWGLDIELARGFAAQLGVGVIFHREAESYNAAVDEVVQRKTDLAWCKLSRTFDRAMRVRYTNPYVVLRQALLINRLALAKQARSDIPIEETVQKLKGNIGVISKSAYEEYASKYFRHAKVISFDTWDQVVLATARGQVVAAYRDELEVKRVIKGSPEASLTFKTAVISDTSDALAIAVAWDNTTLVALLNIYLENQRLNLNADKILDKYSHLLFKK
jgi:ABC-type amino acid transport substrate-binding protein